MCRKEIKQWEHLIQQLLTTVCLSVCLPVCFGGWNTRRVGKKTCATLRRGEGDENWRRRKGLISKKLFNFKWTLQTCQNNSWHDVCIFFSFPPGIIDDKGTTWCLATLTETATMRLIVYGRRELRGRRRRVELKLTLDAKRAWKFIVPSEFVQSLKSLRARPRRWNMLSVDIDHLSLCPGWLDERIQLNILITHTIFATSWKRCVAYLQGGGCWEVTQKVYHEPAMGRLHLTKSETRFNTDKTITFFYFFVRPVETIVII
jgi:hypothetical protein